MCRPGHVRLQTLFLLKGIIYLYWTYFRPNTGKKTHKLCRQCVAEELQATTAQPPLFMKLVFRNNFKKGSWNIYLLIQYSPVSESLKLSCWWVKHYGWHIWDWRKLRRKKSPHCIKPTFFFFFNVDTYSKRFLHCQNLVVKQSTL